MTNMQAGFALPDKPQSIATTNPDPLTQRVYLVGPPKRGKTTLAAAWAPKSTLFIDLQHGTDLLPGEHYVAHVDDWATFEKVIDQIVAPGQDRFKTIVIDPIDIAYKYADAAAGAKKGQVAAGLIEYGKGTAEAEGLFRRAINKLLARRDLGVWFIGHTKPLDDGVYLLSLDQRVQGYIIGEVGHIFLAEKIGNRLVLQTQASQRFPDAGSRFPLPSAIDMDAHGLYRAFAAGIKQLQAGEAIQAVSATAEPVEPAADPDDEPDPSDTPMDLSDAPVAV